MTEVSTQLKRKERQPGGAPLVLFTLTPQFLFWHVVVVCMYKHMQRCTLSPSLGN